MPSTREMRLRIRSIKNITQVTKALETVSASKVRRAMAAVAATRPYADKAWKVLVHLARQPGHASLHPLLVEREQVKNVLVLMISGSRGLAGAYNINVLRFMLDHFAEYTQPISYIAVGKKGRDMLIRRRYSVIAEFSDLPEPPSFIDVSPIGRLLVDDYLNGRFDQVYIAYTHFKTMARQTPVVRKLLPLDVDYTEDGKEVALGKNTVNSVFTYEPDANEILGGIIERFTAMQVYQSILSAQASEHAARMVAMRNATDNALQLLNNLQLDYNKARQQSITNDILDIVGGANALAISQKSE
jgi:F-type H+-transporting ATPase subunit gamma